MVELCVGTRDVSLVDTVFGHLREPQESLSREEAWEEGQRDIWSVGAGSRHLLGVWKALGTRLGDLLGLSGRRPGLVSTSSPPHPQCAGVGTRMLFSKATGTLPVSPRN